MIDSERPGGYDRRRFLGRVTLGVAGLSGAVVAAPALANLVAPAFQTGTFEAVDLASVESYPVDRASPWQVVTFESRDPDPTGLARRIAFVRNDGDGTFSAL